MDLTSYSGLVAAVTDTINRPDLASVAPAWVAMATAEASRILRTPDMETRAALVVSNELTDLPTDLVDIRWVSHVGTTRAMQRVPEHAIDALDTTATGDPCKWARVGNQIKVWPVPTGQTLALTYWARVPAIDGGNASNWLLAKHPDFYLYGALKHSAPYLVEDPRLAMWQGLFADVVSTIGRDASRAGWSSGMSTN